MNINIDSDEAIEFNDHLFEFYSYKLFLASSNLAKEKGSYETYQGSLWSQNIFPIDSLIMCSTEYRKAKSTTGGGETLIFRMARAS